MLTEPSAACPIVVRSVLNKAFHATVFQDLCDADKSGPLVDGDEVVAHRNPRLTLTGTTVLK